MKARPSFDLSSADVSDCDPPGLTQSVKISTRMSRVGKLLQQKVRLELSQHSLGESSFQLQRLGELVAV